MTDNSIGGPGPSGSAAQTPTPGVPNTTNQTPVGANTGHETPAGSGPSNFTSGGSGPGNFTSGGSGPGNFTSGGSGPNSNSGGPGRRNQNNRGPGRRNQNNRGPGRGNQNSGRTHQQRPADIDPIEEEETYKQRSQNLGYESISANGMLNPTLPLEIFFERRDQKGDVLLHRNHQDTVNWYVPSLDKPCGGEFLGMGVGLSEVKTFQGLIGCDQESLHALLVTVDSMVRHAKKKGAVIMKFVPGCQCTLETVGQLQGCSCLVNNV